MSVISSLSDIKSMYSSYSNAYSALSMKNSAMQNTSNANDGMFGMSTVLSSMDKLKNGYYKKLYNGEITADSTEDTTTTTNTTLKNAALSLKSSAAALDDESLYAKDSDGKLDTDAIYKKVNQFVTDYNSMVKKTADATDLKVLQKGVVMVNSTTTSEGLLKRVGITINSDNTLSLDKDKLAAAEAYELKSAFSDSYSYGSKIEQKATQISSMIGSSAATYTNTGTLSYSYSTIFNMNQTA